MRNLIALSLSLALTGCMVGPDYQAPKTAEWQPEQWQLANNQSAGAVTQSWWQEFEDPTLTHLIKQAMSDNLMLLSAQERVKLARSYREAVSATNLPQVGLGMGYTAGMLSEQGPVGGPLRNPMVGGQPLGMPLVSRHYDATYLGASVGWEPDLFGKTARLIEASDARAEQVEILADGTRLLVISAVANNYLQLRSAQQQKQLIGLQQQDLLELKQKVGALHASGLASNIEQAQIESQLASVSSLLPQLDSVIDVHSRRLSILVGQSPSALLEELSEVKPLPQVEGVIPVGLPSELLNRRPDIRIAERQMKVANAELGVAIARQYPSFYMTGTPGVVSSDFSELFASGSSAWTFGAGMNWSLFDGGLRDALEAVAEAEVNIAAMDYQRTLLNAFGEVETLLTAYGNSELQLAQVQAARDKVADAVASTHTLEQAGLVSPLDYLQARANLHQADAALLQAKTQQAQLLVTLYKSLGGVWGTNAPQAEEEGA